MDSACFKHRVYRTLEPPPDHALRGARELLVERLLLVLIIVNVVAVMLETVDALDARFGRAFLVIEIVSVAVFTIEYVLRLWSCTVDPRYGHPVLGRLRYALRPLSIIDLLAILPAYLAFTSIDLRFLRAARLVRLLRILKVAHYTDSLNLLAGVLRSKRSELTVMLFVLCILLVLSAGLIYHLENEAQPDAFSSIPASLWWAVITLTTIGYGDVYPVTPLGRVAGGLIAVMGIGIVALPTAVIAAGFAEELQRRRKGKAPATCPHCGKPIDAPAEPTTAPTPEPTADAGTNSAVRGEVEAKAL